MDETVGYTRYPTERNNEYKYWGWWGPAPTRMHLLQGALAVFIVIPLVVLGIAALLALLLVAIAVPPVGIACVKALVCSS